MLGNTQLKETSIGRQGWGIFLLDLLRKYDTSSLLLMKKLRCMKDILTPLSKKSDNYSSEFNYTYDGTGLNFAFD